MERPLSVKALDRALPEVEAGQIGVWLDAGQGASVDLLIEDLIADLEGRSFEVARVAGGWILRTWPVYAAAIWADAGEQD